VLQTRELDSCDALMEQWQALERRTAPGIFLSRLWVETWLETHRPEGLAVEFRHEGGGLALGLFGIRDRCAYLHQTGDAGRDQIWIEYNGMVGDAALQVPALEAAIKSLTARPDISEAHLSMLPSAVGEALMQSLPRARIYQRVVGWARDLKGLRERGIPLLDALSPNTRYQLRRSRRRYEARFGPLFVEEAKSLDDAEDAWQQAGQWHRARWADSGFINPAFLDFHQRLLKRGFDHGVVRIYRVGFGSETIAVLYLLCDAGRAYFYLQGVRSETDGHLKPGLTAHWALMQTLMDEGWDTYDFMGGDSQYKRQLADQRIEFLSLRIHDGSLRQRGRDLLRDLRNRFVRVSAS
jgi:CelD/BcsL family acetyltransferase involved in cellulose biosynthesis